MVTVSHEIDTKTDTDFSIRLTAKELGVLHTIFASLGGDPYSSPRQVTDAIYEQTQELFDKLDLDTDDFTVYNLLEVESFFFKPWPPEFVPGFYQELEDWTNIKYFSSKPAGFEEWQRVKVDDYDN